MTVKKTKIKFLSFSVRRTIPFILIYFLLLSSSLTNAQVRCTGISTTPNPVCTGNTVNLKSSGYFMDTTQLTSFIDISTTGININSDPLEDDGVYTIALPFTFLFNGNASTIASISNNGLMVLGSTGGYVEYTNECLPQSTDKIGDAGNAAICAYWDDLTPQTATSIKTKLIGSLFIVQWTNEDNYEVVLNNNITFQIQLEQTTNKITLVYQDVFFGDSLYDAGRSATIGLNFSDSTSVSYSCNTKSLRNGLSISFVPFSQLNNLTYSWSGPNNFTSASQTPVINNFSAVNDGLYRVTVTKALGGTSRDSILLYSPNCSRVKLKAFIQGYYFGGGKMFPVLQNQGVSGATDAMVDTVTVTLHKTNKGGTDPLAFYTIIDSKKAVVDTGGNVSVVMNAGVVGTYYYLSISSRNTILTVSADSIRFNALITSYDFTDLAEKAYGSNLFQNNDGTWSIYSGDISQDEYIATDDVTIVDNDNILGFVGYNHTDLSGDGYCGTDDVTVADNNNFFGIFSIHY